MTELADVLRRVLAALGMAGAAQLMLPADVLAQRDLPFKGAIAPSVKDPVPDWPPSGDAAEGSP